MKDKINSILPYIIIIIVVLLIKKLVVTPIKVNGESMMPTLEEKEIMILNKTAYYFNEPQRFDIVVVETKNEYLIKRIIGLPNEEIEYKDNVLYVNGKRTKEPFAHGKTENFMEHLLCIMHNTFMGRFFITFLIVILQVKQSMRFEELFVHVMSVLNRIRIILCYFLDRNGYYLL